MNKILHPTLRRVVHECNLTLAAEQHSQNSHFAEPAWPTMGDDAYHGLAGKVVSAIEPHTESDPVAILIQFLTSVGNIVGNCPYYQVEGSRHRANLFNVLVGQSSKARKGTSWIAFQKLSGSRTSDGTASASRVVCPPVKGLLMKFATNSRNGTERRERGRWSILASPTSA